MIIFSRYPVLVKKIVIQVMEPAAGTEITMLITVFMILKFIIIYLKKGLFSKLMFQFAIIVYKTIKITVY